MLPSFSIHGPDEGWPIVFIHGFPFSRAQWSPQVEELQSQFRVITYDLRGHGQSEVGPAPMMIEFLVDDLVELLDRLEIERATICGLSMGGYVALRAVDRHPERVSGLILCDTRADADDNEARLKRASAIRAIRANGMEAFAEKLLPALFGEGARSVEGPGVEAIRQQIRKTDPDGACQALAAMACRLDLTDRLGSINTPTLVIVGEDDAITPPGDSRRMQDAIPNARLIEIPGAGHVSNLSQPQAFNAAVLDFLGSVRTRSSDT